MTYALVTGTLLRAPEQRTSKSGKPFATGTLIAKDSEAAQWWRVTAFSENAQAELLRLREGEAVSVQGPLKVETYEKDGETKIALSIIANNVLPLRQPREKTPPRERCAATERPFDGAILY
jgi:single-stranded DNA-binding protein